jgi:hypothetical protein
MASTTLVCPDSTAPVGAMTTPYTFPPDCAYPIPWVLDYPTTGSCVPPNFDAYDGCEPRFYRYYSPAVCPYGYTIASSGAAQQDVRTLPGESVATCCPL